MQANIWQTFFILTLRKFLSHLDFPGHDLPICKYKNHISFTLPLRLMVRVLQVAAESRGLCNLEILLPFPAAEIPEVSPSQSHGCIHCCSCLQNGPVARLSWCRVCVRACVYVHACVHAPIYTTCTVSADSPVWVLLSVWSRLGFPADTPHPQSQVHKHDDIHGPSNISMASKLA